MKDNRVIVITGASRGLGRAIALRFGQAGCRVLLNYREQQDQAKIVQSLIARSGGEAILCQADVSLPKDVERMCALASDTWGSLDVMINNAGANRDGLLLRLAEQDWDAVLTPNLTGPFYCMRAAAGYMTKSREGAIINIVSISGVQGREGQANYAASKAGLIGLTKAAAREFGPSNIRVNAVLPGYLDTAMGKTVSPQAQERIVRESVLGRSSDREEVADFIHHLSAMRNVSGQVFNLDSRIL